MRRVVCVKDILCKRCSRYKALQSALPLKVGESQASLGSRPWTLFLHSAVNTFTMMNQAPFHSAFLLLVFSATFAHADETSTWSSFIHCKCGVACAKQLESWYMFDIGQSCACEACPESGHLRGSQEDLQAASEEKKMQAELVEKPDAAEKSRSTESSEPKVKVSQSLQSSAENEWDGASVRGTNLLYCKCGKACSDLRQTGRNTFYCYNYACRQCGCTTTFCWCSMFYLDWLNSVEFVRLSTLVQRWIAIN